ncbi:MAG TPA: hypothetical protein VNT60_11440 [Deinococcales bacterium]|nr:hypothetical protein [Deinococcales bacterium]
MSKTLTMGVCPRCGQAFHFTAEELERPMWLGGSLYLEGYCLWCDVRAIVPTDQTFLLETEEVMAPPPVDGEANATPTWRLPGESGA